MARHLDEPGQLTRRLGPAARRGRRGHDHRRDAPAQTRMACGDGAGARLVRPVAEHRRSYRCRGLLVDETSMLC